MLLFEAVDTHIYVYTLCLRVVCDFMRAQFSCTSGRPERQAVGQGTFCLSVVAVVSDDVVSAHNQLVGVVMLQERPLLLLPH